MQLLLLLELEDLGGLHREHVLDVVEDHVVVLHVERAAHVELRLEGPGQLEGLLHAPVGVGGPVDADHDPAPLEGLVVPDHEGVLLDAPQRPGHHPAELGVGLAPEAVGPDDHEVVLPSGGAHQLRRVVLVLGEDAPVLVQLDVAAHLVAAVVARRLVRVEADEAGEASLALVHLGHDLLVVDPLEELAGEGNARRLATRPHLVEEAVRDELEPLLDELVVDLALPLDLLGSLKLGRQARLELPEAHVVEPRGVDVVGGDAPAGVAGHLDGTVDRPVRMLGVVHRHEHLCVHVPSLARLSVRFARV